MRRTKHHVVRMRIAAAEILGKAFPMTTHTDPRPGDEDAERAALAYAKGKKNPNYAVQDFLAGIQWTSSHPAPVPPAVAELVEAVRKWEAAKEHARNGVVAAELDREFAGGHDRWRLFGEAEKELRDALAKLDREAGR